jgi:hypothetical protein
MRKSYRILRSIRRFCSKLKFDPGHEIVEVAANKQVNHSQARSAGKDIVSVCEMAPDIIDAVIRLRQIKIVNSEGFQTLKILIIDEELVELLLKFEPGISK